MKKNEHMNINDIFREGVAREVDFISQHERLGLRQGHCGSFESKLIDAWFIADAGNKRRLEQAFKGTAFDLR